MDIKTIETEQLREVYWLVKKELARRKRVKRLGYDPEDVAQQKRRIVEIDEAFLRAIGD